MILAIRHILKQPKEFACIICLSIFMQLHMPDPTGQIYFSIASRDPAPFHLVASSGTDEDESENTT